MYVQRDIQGQLSKLAPVYPIIAVVGPRQAGKTTFLKAQERGTYILFDDPDVRGMFNEDVKKFQRQYLKEKEIAILDEVQQGQDPGHKLKYLADIGHKMWITSSSETLLSSKVLSYLVGRVSILRLFPFSFAEFLSYKGHKESTPQAIMRESEEHVMYGGYPKVVTTPDIDIKKTILKDLYETMILKDIARTFSIEDISSLERFVHYLAINTGGQLSYETISKTINISYQTIQKYLDAMEKSYLIFRVKPYYTNKNKELSKREKIYLLDTGLRNSIVRAYTFDGKAFENYVAAELFKRGIALRYWLAKTRAEVDFVIEQGNEIIPVEVKISEKVISKGMRAFITHYRPKKAYYLIHKGHPQVIKKDGCTIRFIRIDTFNELRG